MSDREPNASSTIAASEVEGFIESAINAQEQGRLAEAAALFERVLRVEPNHPDALCHYAMLALHAGRPDVALPVAERVAVLRAESAVVQNLLGVAYRHSGRLADAIARLRVDR